MAHYVHCVHIAEWTPTKGASAFDSFLILFVCLRNYIHSMFKCTQGVETQRKFTKRDYFKNKIEGETQF